VLGEQRDRQHCDGTGEELDGGAGAQVHGATHPLLVERAPREPGQPEQQQADACRRATSGQEVVDARDGGAQQRQRRTPPARAAQPFAEHGP